MIRLALLPALLAVAVSAAEPRITATAIDSPAVGPGAGGASLTMAQNGEAWLTWLETEGATTTLRFATFDATRRQWSTPGTIARGPDWFVNQADFPALTADAHGRATAVWFVNNPATSAAAADHEHHGPGYRAFISSTTDRGQTWTAPAPLTRESDAVEFVSLATLADGRVLAAWLDGRARKKGGKAQQLFARILQAAEPDTLIDAAVCDCCQTTLSALPDGSALLAYRDRSDDEVRDIRITRFRDGAWDEPHPLSDDEWRINACPVNGPQIATDGGRVAAAWFTAADNDPRVLATFSPDAGARFLMPLRLSDTKPAGRVATALLHDGAFLVTWVDATGALWLRRVTPDFTATEPVLLSPAEAGRVRGFPRVALVRDYQGGKEPAEILIALAREGVPELRTLLVTVPEGDLLEAEKSCDCAPTPEQLRGFSIRGVIAGVQPEAAAMQIQHFEVPGIFAAGTREFRVPPAVLAGGGQPGRQFLGRIEKRDGAWWLIEVRLIAGPAR